jgi:hypothetical protein
MEIVVDKQNRSASSGLPVLSIVIWFNRAIHGQFAKLLQETNIKVLFKGTIPVTNISIHMRCGNVHCRGICVLWCLQSLGGGGYLHQPFEKSIENRN